MDFESILNAIVNLDFQSLLGALTFEVALGVMIACIITAFFALRLYKIYISILGAFVFGMTGYMVMAELLDTGVVPVIEGINLHIVAGFGAALIGFLLASWLQKFVLFLEGAAVGFVLGGMLTTLLASIIPAIPTDETATLVISGVVALITGALICALFKPIYLFITSIGGMALAAIVIACTCLPYDLVTFIIAAIVGAVIGIIPMIYQFRRDAEGA